jgi:hypothetical protein
MNKMTMETVARIRTLDHDLPIDPPLREMFRILDFARQIGLRAPRRKRSLED